MPHFSTTIILCDPPRIYHSIPEYTPLFKNYIRHSQNLPSLQEHTPPSSFKKYYIMRHSQNIPLPPRIYPFFNKFLCATLPESTPLSQNTPPLINRYMCPPPPQHLSLPPFMFFSSGSKCYILSLNM